jgi:hypothetical protein
MIRYQMSNRDNRFGIAVLRGTDPFYRIASA